MDIRGSQESLVDVFGRIERVLWCLEIYTEVQPTMEMTGIIV